MAEEVPVTGTNGRERGQRSGKNNEVTYLRRRTGDETEEGGTETFSFSVSQPLLTSNVLHCNLLV